jgi:hypothetical protein
MKARLVLLVSTVGKISANGVDNSDGWRLLKTWDGSSGPGRWAWH